MPSHKERKGPTSADLVGVALPKGASPNRIALGPWRNEKTFWVDLVEKRRLVHFGFRMGRNELRDALAIGPAVFSGRPRPTTSGLVRFIESRTKRYLEGKGIRRIYFDVTTMKKLTGEHGDGYFAFFELDLLLRTTRLLNRTRFFENGRPLPWKGQELIRYLRSLFEM
jgi:hypothetical protein